MGATRVIDRLMRMPEVACSRTGLIDGGADPKGACRFGSKTEDAGRGGIDGRVAARPGSGRDPAHHRARMPSVPRWF